jgi:O-antigen/teichoic acid export membrane protein
VSNLISLAVSVLVILVVPKLIGVEEYGYWQLYLFYIAYVGFLHFGWNDGIYLRYGGAEYENLDKDLFHSQFQMLTFLQIGIAIIISISSILFVTDSNRTFILLMVALCLIITNSRWMLIYTLQATKRIKEYAQITIIGRVLYISIIVICLAIGIRDYKTMIVADIVGRFISLAYAAYCCRDIVFRKVTSFYFSFSETLKNISTGAKLMFANIASLLIIGVIRFGIERSWDVSTFGKVSLTLSVSNMMMIFINALGIIMFPLLRRTDNKNLPGIYASLRDILMTVMLGVMIVYYPMKEVLSIWLPNYAESLKYMALLFPIFIYEGKMALLINTYLKTLRKESLMLKINLISLTLSFLSAFIFILVFRDLNLLIVSIVFLLGFRSILAEILLSRLLNVSVIKDILLEIILTIVFILSGWILDSWGTVLIYGSGYIVYLLIKRKDLSATAGTIRKLIKA